jgi:anti-sigma factor RsiW
MKLLTPDLTCQQAVELVTDYLEGRLTWRQRRRFERHLRGCDNCRRYLEQIRETIRLAGQVEPDSIDSATRADLIDLYRRFRDER